MKYKLIEDLYKENKVPANIIRHMQKVAKVCKYLAKNINNTGIESANADTIEKAALLHDIKKLDTDSRINHEENAAATLIKLGEKQIAEVIRKHGFDSPLKESDRPDTIEEKILYYADKRVLHDKIVTIEQRLEDGRKRYAKDKNIPEEEKKIELFINRLEQELCELAQIKPGDINEQNINEVK